MVWVSLSQRDTDGYLGYPPRLNPQNVKYIPWFQRTWEHDGGKRKFQLKSGDSGFSSMPGSWVRSLHLLSRAQSFHSSHRAGPDRIPTPGRLTMRLVCVTGWGPISCNPLFGYLGSGYLPLWDRGAQRDYAPCSKPQNLEHQGQDRNLGFWFKIQCSSHKPGTSHLLCLRSYGSISQSNPILLVWTPSWSSLIWNRSFKEGRFYHFASSFFFFYKSKKYWHLIWKAN